MKIGIVGCGAVGSFYGAKLCRAGEETHFLLRSDYEVVRRGGVRIESPEGNFHVNPKCAREPETIGPCDLILIGLKTTANHSFGQLITPLLGPESTILTLQNGLGNEEELAELFGGDRVMGGLCFVCLNRVRPGLIQHLAHGKVILGEYAGWPEPRTHDIATLFRHAGIPCQVAENLEKAHWEKLVWNIPFNGLGVASAAGYEAVATGKVIGPIREPLTTDRLLGELRWETLVRELMAEIISAANGLGLGLSSDLIEEMIQKTRVMGEYKPSTVIDFERKEVMELGSLFIRPLGLALEAGAYVPRWEGLVSILEEMNGDSREQGAT